MALATSTRTATESVTFTTLNGQTTTLRPELLSKVSPGYIHLPLAVVSVLFHWSCMSIGAGLKGLAIRACIGFRGVPVRLVLFLTIHPL